ncbi:MAG: L,D-transpeptidase [Planctomycetes bacterium]|nr:L,D-transpeptidase [Planctomycetota bacterium]
MRTLLLALLAGGLLWSCFRSSDEDEVAAGHELAPAGEMLTPEADESGAAIGAPVARIEAPTAPREDAHRAAPTTVAPPPPAPKSVPQTQPVEASAISAPPEGPPAAEGQGLEVELGALLVHAPDRVEARLSSLEGELPASRAKLVRIYAALALGDGDRASKLAQGLDDEAGLRAEEVDFARRGAQRGGAVPAASSTAGPLLRGARLALLALEAERQAREGRTRLAALQMTEAVLTELSSPWTVEDKTLVRWGERLEEWAQKTRWRRDAEWPSIDVVVQPGESLIAIRKRVVAQHPELLVCTGLIARSNQLRGDIVHPGEKLRIPTERVSVLVDLSAHWAFYRIGDEITAAWPVGVGKQGSETKPGAYRVGDKRRDPMWFPPGQEPVPFGDPRNPLGSRWIELELPDGRATHLGFHGTNEPESVGKDASQGCLRMRQADVEELFEILPAGVTVEIQG